MVKKQSKAKKEKVSTKRFIARAPIRRLMKNEGATLVSEIAVSLLVSKLEEIGAKVTKRAVAIVKDDKRKRVLKQDIILGTK